MPPRQTVGSVLKVRRLSLSGCGDSEHANLKHPSQHKENEMAEKKAATRAPGFSLPTISILSGEEAYAKGPVVLAFYDRHGSDF